MRKGSTVGLSQSSAGAGLLMKSSSSGMSLDRVAIVRSQSYAPGDKKGVVVVVGILDRTDVEAQKEPLRTVDEWR